MIIIGLRRKDLRVLKTRTLCIQYKAFIKGII